MIRFFTGVMQLSTKPGGKKNRHIVDQQKKKHKITSLRVLCFFCCYRWSIFLSLKCFVDNCNRLRSAGGFLCCPFSCNLFTSIFFLSYVSLDPPQSCRDTSRSHDKNHLLLFPKPSTSGGRLLAVSVRISPLKGYFRLFRPCVPRKGQGVLF